MKGLGTWFRGLWVHIAIYELMFRSGVYVFVRFDGFDPFHVQIEDCELLLPSRKIDRRFVLDSSFDLGSYFYNN